MRRALLVASIVIVVISVFGHYLPEDPQAFGLLTLVPSLFLIVYIFWTKRILEALILASLMGFLMVHRGGFFEAFNDAVLKVLMSEDMAWLFLVCGLMRSIIALIEHAGGSFAFGDWVSRRAKTRESSLLWAWVLGMAIFIDDYLNSLTVGSSMAPVTDRHKVSREMLAYVVDSTAAPVCVLIPISTWGVFVGRLLESNGLAAEGEGLVYFLKTIPYNFYAWFAAAIVPLVILGIIPVFGPMKRAEARATETGVLAPPGSEKIDIKAGEELHVPKRPRLVNFFAPMLFLVAATIYFDVDMARGVVSTMAFMFVIYVVQDLVGAAEFADLSVKGIKNMLFPLMMMVLAFTFAEANEQIGFTAYVIQSAAPLMSPALMPVITFFVLGVTEFITGTNWGMYVIALPIVIPLSQTIGADPVLAVAAVLSAGVWGAHICFYSDATILSSAAAGCDNLSPRGHANAVRLRRRRSRRHRLRRRGLRDLKKGAMKIRGAWTALGLVLVTGSALAQERGEAAVVLGYAIVSLIGRHVSSSQMYPGKGNGPRLWSDETMMHDPSSRGRMARSGILPGGRLCAP